MANLTENAITRLSTTTGVDMQTAAATTLYTVPTGKTAYITHVVIRDPSVFDLIFVCAGISCIMLDIQIHQ